MNAPSSISSSNRILALCNADRQTGRTNNSLTCKALRPAARSRRILTEAVCGRLRVQRQGHGLRELKREGPDKSLVKTCMLDGAPRRHSSRCCARCWKSRKSSSANLFSEGRQE